MHHGKVTVRWPEGVPRKLQDSIRQRRQNFAEETGHPSRNPFAIANIKTAILE
jgi:hypothetical protein